MTHSLNISNIQFKPIFYWNALFDGIEVQIVIAQFIKKHLQKTHSVNRTSSGQTTSAVCVTFLLSKWKYLKCTFCMEKKNIFEFDLLPYASLIKVDQTINKLSKNLNKVQNTIQRPVMPYL